MVRAASFKFLIMGLDGRLFFFVVASVLSLPFPRILGFSVNGLCIFATFLFFVFLVWGKANGLDYAASKRRVGSVLNGPIIQNREPLEFSRREMGLYPHPWVIAETNSQEAKKKQKELN